MRDDRCSGTLKDGSLRVVRNGIGINEQAAVELPGIKALWSLRDADGSAYDKYLVQSFIGETRVLEISDEELAETEMDGFDHAAQSVWCGNVADEYLVQVTEKSMRLVSCSMKTLVKEWSPPGRERITVVAGHGRQILLAVGKTTLVYLRVEKGDVTEIARMENGHEIACLNLCPLGVEGSGGAEEATLAVVVRLACCLLLAACYLLLVTYYFSLVTYYLMLITCNLGRLEQIHHGAAAADAGEARGGVVGG